MLVYGILAKVQIIICPTFRTSLLDLAVDRLYSKTKFANDVMRVAHLFALYEKLTLRK